MTTLTFCRGLNSESVDLIYLDPPFNSNQDYAAPVGSKAAGFAQLSRTIAIVFDHDGCDVCVEMRRVIEDEEPGVWLPPLSDGWVCPRHYLKQSYLTLFSAVRLLEMYQELKDHLG